MQSVKKNDLVDILKLSNPFFGLIRFRISKIKNSYKKNRNNLRKAKEEKNKIALIECMKEDIRLKDLIIELELELDLIRVFQKRKNR